MADSFYAPHGGSHIPEEHTTIPGIGEHTEFLDLTNGIDVGASVMDVYSSPDLPPNSVDPTASFLIDDGFTLTTDQQHQLPAVAQQQPQQQVVPISNPATRSSATTSPAAGVDGVVMSTPTTSQFTNTIDPSTTSGGGRKGRPPASETNSNSNKVVEAGQEHTGRWTREEHEAFLQALQQYGKEWKKVAAKVKTRTVVQTRTHAQKYFQKLQKVMGSNSNIETGTSKKSKNGGLSLPPDISTLNDKDAVKMRTAAATPSTSSLQRKRQRRSHGSQAPTTNQLLQEQLQREQLQREAEKQIQEEVEQLERSSSTLSAAQLMSNLSSVPTPEQKSGDDAANQQHQQQKSPALTVAGPKGMVMMEESPVLPTIQRQQQQQQPPPRRQIPLGPPTPQTANAAASLITASTSTQSSGTWLKSAMKIKLPDQDILVKKNQFPEPSPAACGKRKMAEIAAARMLAGAMGGTVNATVGGMPAPPILPMSKPVLQASILPRVTQSMPSSSQLPQQQQLVPQGIDGDVTPPPISSQKQEIESNLLPAVAAKLAASASTTGNSSSSIIADRPASAPPAATTAKSKFGLSLQIVNPETLGVSHVASSSANKRRRGDVESPTTPWDGQLEALVKSESKTKDTGSKKDVAADDVGPNLHEARCPVEFPHPVCGPGTGYSRSSLHQAVCEMNVKAVQSCLSVSGGKTVSTQKNLVLQCDDAGFYPIHSSSALSMMLSKATNGQVHNPISGDITRLLLSAGADATCTDADGNTPLHWAARAGDEEVTHMLLMRNCPPDAQNKQGETPLHWAMRVGRSGIRVVSVLLEKGGARASIFNKLYRRPLDVAAEGFVDKDNSGAVTPPRAFEKFNNNTKLRKAEQKRLLIEKTEEKCETRAHFLKLSSHSRTLVLHHPECLEHIPKSKTDWEVPDRVNSIIRRIVPDIDETGAATTSKVVKAPSTSPDILPHEVAVSSDFDRAKIDLLNRVHSSDYLSFVNDLSKDLERKRKEALCPVTNAKPHIAVPFTPMVQRTLGVEEESVKMGDHSDTSFSAGSLRAARRAAGAVQHAVDRVLVGRNRNAFCVVRPPGHHAGVKGLLAGGESCGFCIFNNVAAGAMHAISDERLICERCAIVDIDVHHGNGTEEIVKKSHDPGRLLFFSIHLYDNDKPKKTPASGFVYKFYPGTGYEDDLAHNIINVPIAPLWKEKEVSNTAVPKRNTHNTRRKAKEKAAAVTDSSAGGDESVSSKASDTENGTNRSTHSSRSASSSPRLSMGSGRHAYRQAIQHRLIPALRAFNPDLILISAGFDANRGDVGNAKHIAGAKELMGLDLTPDDYAWTTRKILEVADICCQGRVVSVLEGGYGKTPPATSASNTTDTGSNSNNEAASSPSQQDSHELDKSLFSECAMRHLQAMIDPYDAEKRFPCK